MKFPTVVVVANEWEGDRLSREFPEDTTFILASNPRSAEGRRVSTVLYTQRALNMVRFDKHRAKATAQTLEYNLLLSKGGGA